MEIGILIFVLLTVFSFTLFCKFANLIYHELHEAPPRLPAQSHKNYFD